MGIFEEDVEEVDEEEEELIEEILDLYNDMNGKDSEELIKNSNGYYRWYEKIMHKLEDYYERDILGPGVPNFLVELIEEIQEPGILMGTTRITRIERGIRKISRKLDIELPEKRQKEVDTSKESQTHVHINQSQMQSQAQSQSTEIELQNLMNEFEREMKEPIKDKPKIKSVLEKIIKSGGKFAPWIAEFISKFL